tara:strand:- start:550 stop:1140 length:591 start_codon:yes stop_codon:yes gene_type:complete
MTAHGENNWDEFLQLLNADSIAGGYITDVYLKGDEVIDAVIDKNFQKWLKLVEANSTTSVDWEELIKLVGDTVTASDIKLSRFLNRTPVSEHYREGNPDTEYVWAGDWNGILYRLSFDTVEFSDMVVPLLTLDNGTTTSRQVVLYLDDYSMEYCIPMTEKTCAHGHCPKVIADLVITEPVLKIGVEDGMKIRLKRN